DDDYRPRRAAPKPSLGVSLAIVGGAFALAAIIAFALFWLRASLPDTNFGRGEADATLRYWVKVFLLCIGIGGGGGGGGAVGGDLVRRRGAHRPRPGRDPVRRRAGRDRRRRGRGGVAEATDPGRAARGGPAGGAMAIDPGARRQFVDRRDQRHAPARGVR